MDTLLPMMFLGLRRLRNICCGHKMFLNKIRNFFWCPSHKICVHNKCCGRGQTGKHLCRQQCVRSNVSSFARAFKYRLYIVHFSLSCKEPLYLKLINTLLSNRGHVTENFRLINTDATSNMAILCINIREERCEISRKFLIQDSGESIYAI